MSKIIILLLVVGAVLFFYKRFAGGSQDATANIEKGAAYLQSNAQREEVTTTASGLQYEILAKSENTDHPKASDKVKVHYHGTLIDGSVFDSSVERGDPISFGLSQVIKGWTEGVQLMSTGDKFRFYIPHDLAYGKRRAGSIGPGSTLIFDVELLAIGE